MSSTSPTCEWRPGAVCQFPGLQQTVAKYDGRWLCHAHAPSGTPLKTYDWMRSFVIEQSRAGALDFSGCIFPAGPANGRGDYNFPVTSSSVRTVCRDCRFEGETSVGGAWQEFDLSNGQFAGKMYVSGFGRALTCVNSVFEGDVEIGIGQPRTVVDFSRCYFAGGLVLGGLENCSRLSFDGARLGAVPVLHVRIPQQTTFTGARFLPGTLVPENEGAYRNIRNQFAANRAREWEGFFYRYEKICHRRSLPWSSKWFARTLSYLYDLTAQYGQSYERALLAFVTVQIGFGVGYAIAAHRFGVPGQFDGTIACSLFRRW